MKRFEAKAVAWARSQAAVRALLLVGSRARAHPAADEWADLDFEVFATGVGQYLSNTAWLEQLGELWATVVVNEPAAQGERALLALFAGGDKIDFHFRPLDYLSELTRGKALPEPFVRGYRVLIDKDGLAARLPPAAGVPPAADPPSLDEFCALVENFWYGAVYVAKQIRRRNLWVGKYRDWTMKECLLKMMEWQARATRGQHIDTFYDGHFLHSWVDPSTWEALGDAFGRFDAPDASAALLATMALFHELATESAAALDYTYDRDLDDNVTRLVKRLIAP